MAIFRKAREQDPLVVSVTGVRLGHRVLVVPGRDLRVLVDVATRVGLTGRALVLASDAAAVARVQQASERQGVLVDADVLHVPLPVADDSFDLAVVDDRTTRAAGLDTAALAPSLVLALRPGGRLIVLQAAGGGVLDRLLGHEAAPATAASLITALMAAGFRTGRVVAVRDGVVYVEAGRSGG
jgi:hypothetical protein